MKLNEEEKAMLAGAFGPLRQWAIDHQIKVGQYLKAPDLVPVMQAHVMADTESLGAAGVEWLESWTKLPEAQRRVRIPTITDPRGTDFAAASRLKQQSWMVDLERRAIDAFRTFGILMTDTCVNYQTIMPPVRGEHAAYGDTGVVIYTNSVCGARSNFEGGPSALSAGLTGRTPRYGFHLDQHRQATLIVNVTWTPHALNEWGALGAYVGKLAGDYWQVPAIVGIDRTPTSDAMKHFGAAMASFGSVALFHIIGVTPEALTLRDVAPKPDALRTYGVTEADVRGLQEKFGGTLDKVDLVVFSAPQLSLVEMRAVALLLEGRQTQIPTLVITSPQVKPDADRMGLTARIEAAGATVLSGMCFYQSYAREMAEANGWKRLATNSAKLSNILGGYGYTPALLSMEKCIDAACDGGRLKK